MSQQANTSIYRHIHREGRLNVTFELRYMVLNGTHPSISHRSSPPSESIVKITVTASNESGPTKRSCLLQLVHYSLPSTHVFVQQMCAMTPCRTVGVALGALAEVFDRRGWFADTDRAELEVSSPRPTPPPPFEIRRRARV